jgi:pre-rRNA-processing protein TSR2
VGWRSPLLGVCVACRVTFSPFGAVLAARKIFAGMATDASTAQFTRAVHVIFGEWTALKLAVENEWAGHSTRDRALALLQRVLSGMLSASTVHRDELEDLLDTALLDEFNIDAEDDSPSQVAQLLCVLHAEAKAGATATADTLLQRAASRPGSSWVEAPPPPRVRGDDDSDDDEVDDDSDDGGGGAMVMDEEGGSSSRQAPIVDDDGFQMVSRGRGRRG